MRFFQATRLLRRHSMIETLEAAGNCYSIHPVVHRWMSYLDSSLKDNESARLALILIWKALPSYDTEQFFIREHKLLSHAERWFGRIQVEPRRTWHAGDEESILALHEVGALFLSQGKSTEGEKVLKWAICDGEKTLGPDHDEAKDVLQRQHLDAERTLGSCPSNNYQDTCLFGDASQQFKQRKQTERGRTDIELLLQRSGTRFERPSTMRCDALVDLGLIYQKQREFTKSEKMYFRAIEESERVFVGHNPELFFTFSRLAAMYGAQGKVDKTIDMYETALQGFQATFYTGHPMISAVMREMERLKHFKGISNRHLINTEADGAN